MEQYLKQSTGDRIFDVFNHIILSFVILLVLYPLVYVASSSISDPMAVMQGKVWLWPVGLNFGAYAKVFENQDILNGYINTIFYTAAGTTLNLLMTIAGAYPLSRKNFRGRNVIMMFITFTMFFNGGLIPTYMLVKQLGLVDNFFVMILPGAVSVYNLIIMRTYFMNSIPNELYESAQIDGCANIKMLIKIVLPLSKPIIAVMLLFYGVGHWNTFFNALIYLSDHKKYPLQLILREILVQTQMSSMVDNGMEVSQQQLYIESIKYSVIIVSSLPVLIVYPFIQKHFVKGVMIGAIKG